MGRLIDADSVTFTDFEIVMCEGDYKKAFKLLCEKLDDAPTIEAEPVKHGHWIVDEDGNIKCSECGHHGVGDNYCERCGAKMDEVTDNG